MQHKRLLYVLLPSVLLIWGIIIYRILQAVRGEDTAAYASLPARTDQGFQQSDPDTIALLANYADPFLSSSRRSVNSSASSFLTARPTIQPSNAITAHPPASVPSFPEVTYLGLIQNGKSNRKVALLRIAGKEYFMEQKRQQDGIILNQIYPDSIRVTFAKEAKTIKISR